MPILKEELDALSKYGVLKTEMPEVHHFGHSSFIIRHPSGKE